MLRFLGSLFVLILLSTISVAQTDHKEVDFVSKTLLKENIAVGQIFVTDHYTSQGITHTYYKESINEIPIYNSRGAIHYKDKNDVMVKHNFSSIEKGIQATDTPRLSALQALQVLASAQGWDRSGTVTTIAPPRGSTKNQTIRARDLSLSDIKASLEYYIVDRTDIRLVWSLPIEDVSTAWLTHYLVDAQTGEVVYEVDWTVECDHGSADHASHDCTHRHFGKSIEKSVSAPVPNSYEVFAWPVESPNFGDRTIETSPWNDNAVASPNGWHTIGTDLFTTTRGNNTDTYLDDDNTNSPTGGDAARADGGATLDFSFPLDVDMDPEDYTDAAITNTFYWTNLMHDVWYNYGFDEASGNFQEENYTVNGIGSDYVRSEAQDGSGTCNANFGTPPDGSNPRMQMYLCTMNGEDRDGDYDNGVIAHEYGHGISNRLTGGPAAAGCLGNQEQMGEGWSDYFGMVMTIEVGDTGPDSRGMGTWLFGEGPDGDGIRPYPYSTDFGINPMTYNTIKTVSVPHGVGSVWCTMLWDMTWAFIDEYGFDTDIYNGTGGNNMAMLLVMEGMKLQACSPGFVDGRDAILEADQMLYGGVNECLIWNVFASRGLGYSAIQGSTNSRSDGIEAFDLPPSCSLNTIKTTATTSATELDQVTYEIIIQNNFPDTNLMDVLVTDTIPAELTFVSASNGGTESAGIVSFPLFDLMAGESDTFEVVLQVKSGLSYVLSDIYDDIEGGTANWTTAFSGSTNWSTQTTTFNSSTTAWFAPDNSSVGTATLDLAFQVGLGSGAELAFYHQYDTEATWDGGQVFISTTNGSKWIDLGPNMTLNGYNSTVFNSIPGFSGNSNGFINTIIDLDEYAGHNVLIRFQMNCDPAEGGNGWWIDDIALSNLKSMTLNEAAASSGIHSSRAFSTAVELIPPSSVFQATLTRMNIQCNGEANGAIQTFPQGGSGSYTYAWHDGATTQNRTNLGGGIYRVTISDGVDQIVKVGIVTEPEALSLAFAVDDVSNEEGDNGSIEARPAGGTEEYSYMWEGGETTAAITGLEAGIYTVTITDANGCMIVDSAEVVKYSCGDTYYDSGGASSNYSNGEDMTMVICSDSPNEDVVLTFNSMNIESTWDALYLYNGNSINSPQFDSGNPETQAGFPAGGYYGNTAPGPFVATNESGCITLRFRSDQFVTRAGWDIDIGCAIACAPEVMNINADGYGSLKRQILCADPIDVIEIGSDVYSESILLDSTLIIDKQLTINPGMGNTVNLYSNDEGPIFDIVLSGSLELNNLNLHSGQANQGGAIINGGILILNDVDIFQSEDNTDPESLIQNNGQLIIRGDSNIIKE